MRGFYETSDEEHEVENIDDSDSDRKYEEESVEQEQEESVSEVEGTIEVADTFQSDNHERYFIGKDLENTRISTDE